MATFSQGILLVSVTQVISPGSYTVPSGFYAEVDYTVAGSGSDYNFSIAGKSLVSSTSVTFSGRAVLPSGSSISMSGTDLTGHFGIKLFKNP